MTSAGLKYAIPTVKQPLTYALDRMATGIGCIIVLPQYIHHLSL